MSKGSAHHKYIPKHWSPMPPNKQYERVRLWEPHSSEFKGVEQLFRRTMNDYVTIVSIERVQNPFLFEKYCRYGPCFLQSIAVFESVEKVYHA